MSAPTTTRTSAKVRTTEPAAGDEAAGGGKKKLIAIVLVVLLAAGAAAYFFLFSGSGEAEPAPVPGAVLTLESTAVNLAGSGYLKIGVTLQLTEEAGKEAPDGARATDIVIETFSGAQLADVTGNRAAMKAELEQRIEDAYNVDGEELVMGIYYTEYVTQ